MLLVELLEKVQALVVLMKGRSRERRGLLLDALHAVHRAANLTRLYMSEASLNEEGSEDIRVCLDNIEFRGSSGLVDVWDEAGRKVAEVWAFDGEMRREFYDLAQRCFAKGAFWACGEVDPQVDIRLGQIVQDTRKAIEAVRQEQ